MKSRKRKLLKYFLNIFELKFWWFVNGNGFMEISFGDLLISLINALKGIKKFNPQWILMLYKYTLSKSNSICFLSSYLFFPLPTSLLYFSFVPPLHFYLYFWSQVHIPLNWNFHYPCCSKSDTMTTMQWSLADTCSRSFLWQQTEEASGIACICKYAKLEGKNQSAL